MKKFTRSFLYFFAPLFLLFVLAFIFVDYNTKPKINEFKINKSINRLAMGDSHMRLAINDELVPGVKNLAHLSESFVYTFNKLKRLSDANPHIDTIYIGVSYHSFADYYDKHTVGEFVLSRYLFTMPAKEQFVLLCKAENPLKLLIKVTLREMKDMLRNKNQDKWVGAFDNEFLNTSIEEKAIKKRINAQYYNEGELNEFSDFNIEYFNKITLLCRSSSITLIAVNTPMHNEYVKLVPGKFKEKYYAIINKSELPLIEFEQLKSKWRGHHFTPDGDHLSMEGSILVSEFLQLNSTLPN